MVSLEGESYVPPSFTIDLSLAPEERYKELACIYAPQLESLTSLFDQLLLDLAIPSWLLPTINRFSGVLLRRVYDDEQTRELRGISTVTRIPLYLLVAFNVVLDLLMGCTSGGVLSRERSQRQSSARMLHFRTLDWTMDPLRKVVIQLDFVRSASSTPDKVVARSITYVGFVGVLTGVRRGVSMSLNFRAVHNASTRKEQLEYRFAQVLVLLGRRPSISSLLRSYLLNGSEGSDGESTDTDYAREDLLKRKTTAAYIIFSDGKMTHAIEKDFVTAQITSSDTFVARTNHDVSAHWGQEHRAPGISEAQNSPFQYLGLEDFLDESCDRLDCIQEKWEERVKILRTRARGESRKTFSNRDAYVTKAQLADWVSSYTTTNSCTHYAAIMDPVEGDIVWSIAYSEPLEEPSMDD